MVLSYLRYQLDATLGVVISGNGHVSVDASGRRAIVPALEAVAVWQVKTGALEQRLVPHTAHATEVTALTLGEDGHTLAVGHADGAIRLWNLSDGEERVTLHGHKGAVLALRLSRSASMLVSGAKDTAVVIWDVVAEAGICRLRGHRDAVTDVCLLEPHHAVATVSKDGSLRLWDLHMQHCIQNVAAPSGELWSVDADAACENLLTGGANAEILSWRLEPTTLVKPSPSSPAITEAAEGAATSSGSVADATNDRPSIGSSGSDGGTWRGVHAVLHGPLIVRVSTSRVVRLRFGLADRIVAVQFADRHLVTYAVQSGAQLKRQLKRRAVKRRKSADGSGADGDGETGEDGVGVAADATEELSAADCYQPLSHVRCSHKLHSFAFVPPVISNRSADKAAADDMLSVDSGTRPSMARLLIAQRNNGLEVHACALKPGVTSDIVASVTSPGHRTEPRGLAMSVDERLLVSTSDGEAKVWSVESRQCVSTLSCGYGLSVAFLLASKYIVVGTKVRSPPRLPHPASKQRRAPRMPCLPNPFVSASFHPCNAPPPVQMGSLQIYNLASAEPACEVPQAHAAAIWSLAVQPGSTRLLSGSADKTVALWSPSDSGEAFTLALVHRHEVGEDVLCVGFTPSAKHVVIGLLDGSIHLLFADSFERFLTLHGHKLPVLSVSASSDNSILVSGSADRPIKLCARHHHH